MRKTPTMKSVLPLILVMALFVVLTACATPAGRSAGQVVDDGSITAQVKAKLLNDNVTKGLAVSVATFEGQVTLTGAVDTPEQRMKAGEIASSVSGVKKVNNLINLKK
jgi:hyperosmotically inducible periplasmic protein